MIFSELDKQVATSLRWKKSERFCATKLGIGLKSYIAIKKKIRDYNKDIEDIRKSTFLPNISEVEEVSEQDQINILNKIIKESKFEYTPVNQTHLNTDFKERVCAVLSLQDIHVGKQVLEDDDIERSVKNCIQNLILRSYHSNYVDKIVFVLGGDLINMDSWSGTTTSGTPVANSTDAYAAYKKAFDLMFWSINYLKQFCNELEVVYIPGNHSRLSEAHIAYAMSKLIPDPHIKWNVDYNERKVIVYGNSMICLEHGDFNTQRSFFVFATEFPRQWGNTEFRTVYTGHFHKEKKVQYITADEINGFTLRTLPSLSKTDTYHREGKWTQNKRGGIIELHSETKGSIGNFSYYE